MKFKSAAMFLLCAALLTSSCYAEFNCTMNDSRREVTLSGTVSGATEGDPIKIELLRKGMKASDVRNNYTDEEAKANFIILRQLPAGAGGAYSVTASMEGRESGYYYAVINGEEYEFYFSTEEDKEKKIAEIKRICIPTEGETKEDTAKRAAKEISQFLDLSNEKSDMVKIFNIKDELVFNIDSIGLSEAIYNINNEITVENFLEKLDICARLQAVNENKKAIMECAEIFGLDTKYTAVFGKLTEERQKDFSKKYYYGKNLNTIVAVRKVFGPAILAEWCAEFASWGDVEKYINEFGEDVGVDTTAFSKLKTGKKQELYLYLANIEKFGSTDEFALKTNEKIKKLISEDKPISGGSSGGGGGGGGSTAGSSLAPTTGIIPSDSVSENSENTENNTDDGSFSDMSDFDWAKESVEALYKKGIVSGTGNGKFEPSRNVTREEMLVMILRAFEEEIGEEKADFADAEADGWYSSYLAAAKKAGYINGRPDGSFGVGDSVTREDAAVMAYNIAKAKGMTLDATKNGEFTDAGEISDYALDAVYALKNAGVLNGKGEGIFAPQSTCTRAEAAKIIYALITE